MVAVVALGVVAVVVEAVVVAVKKNIKTLSLLSAIRRRSRDAPFIGES